MVALLQLGRRHGHERLRAAVEAALALGCHDGRDPLIRRPGLRHAHPAAFLDPTQGGTIAGA
jgi:hypothetical protein